MVKRQVPKPSEIVELMQFRKPSLDFRANRLSRAQSIADLRRIAKRRTPAAAFDCTDGSADREISLARARKEFEDVELHPGVLTDVSHLATATTNLGGPSALPFGIAPIGFTRLMQTEGEIAGARGRRRDTVLTVHPGDHVDRGRPRHRAGRARARNTRSH